MAVKEAIINIAKNQEGLESAAKTYLNVTRYCGKVCSAVGVVISIGEVVYEPNTKNIVKAVMGGTACVLGPSGTVIFTLVDLCGGVDYVAEKIANKIDEYNNSN